MQGQNNSTGPEHSGGDGQGRKRRNERRLGQVGWVALIILIVLGIAYLFFEGNRQQQGELRYSDVVEQFEQENVRSFKVTGTRLTMDLYSAYDGQTALVYDLYDVQMFREDLGSLIDSQSNRGILTGYDYVKGRAYEWLGHDDAFPVPADYSGRLLVCERAAARRRHSDG